jgi:hypothetical protein
MGMGFSKEPDQINGYPVKNHAPLAQTDRLNGFCGAGKRAGLPMVVLTFCILTV